jgi:hypothetical protein
LIWLYANIGVKHMQFERGGDFASTAVSRRHLQLIAFSYLLEA